MKHFTQPSFWRQYERLPLEVQKLADKNYALLKINSFHPSLHFKKIGKERGLWSVRVGDHYRALAYEEAADVVWFWIGTHAEYDLRLA